MLRNSQTWRCKHIISIADYYTSIHDLIIQHLIQMGNSSPANKQFKIQDRFDIISLNEENNLTCLQEKSTKKEFVLKEFIFNTRQQIQPLLQTLEAKKQLLVHPHLVSLDEYSSKEQDQICSTYQRVYALFEYPFRNLERECGERLLQKRRFEEKEIWSILASCILGLAYLQKNNIQHQCLRSSEVLLQKTGLIKIADPFCTSAISNYQKHFTKRNYSHCYLSPELCESLANNESPPNPTIDPYKSDVFTLGLIILETGLLHYQDQIYREEYSRLHFETLHYNIQRFAENYSQELRVMVQLMLQRDSKNRPDWIQLESYVKKNDDQPLLPKNNNPPIAQQVPQQPQIPQQVPQIAQQVSQQPVKVNQQNVNTVRKLNSANTSAELTPIKTSNINEIRPRLAIPPSNSYITHTKVDQNLVEYTQQQSSIHKNISHLYNYKNTSHESVTEQKKVNQVPQIHAPIILGSHKNSENILYSHNNQNGTYIPSANNIRIDQFRSTVVPANNTVQGYINRNTTVSNVTPTQVNNNTQFNYKSNKQLMNPFQPPVSNYVGNTGFTTTFNSYNPVFVPNPTFVNNNTYSNVIGGNVGTNTTFINKIYKEDLSFTSIKNDGLFTDFSKLGLDRKPQQQQPPPVTYTNQTSLNFIKDTPPPLKIVETQSNYEIPQQVKFVVETFPQGSKYEGEKINNLRHGKGKFFYQDGGLYDGHWQQNKMCGQGKLYYQSGKLAYEGNWDDDKFSGHGILYNENPQPLKEQFNYQNFDQIGEYWTKFEGEFLSDLKQGHGRLELTNGEYLQGNFESDYVWGECVYYRKDNSQIRGIWKENHLVEKLQ